MILKIKVTFSSTTGFKTVELIIFPQIFDDWNLNIEYKLRQEISSIWLCYIAKKIPKNLLIIASDVSPEYLE